MTDSEIEVASRAHTPFGSVDMFSNAIMDFRSGARWALNEMEAENAKLRKALEEIAKFGFESLEQDAYVCSKIANEALGKP